MSEILEELMALVDRVAIAEGETVLWTWGQRAEPEPAEGEPVQVHVRIGYAGRDVESLLLALRQHGHLAGVWDQVERARGAAARLPVVGEIEKGGIRWFDKDSEKDS